MSFGFKILRFVNNIDLRNLDYLVGYIGIYFNKEMNRFDRLINHPVPLCSQSGTPLLQKEGKLITFLPPIKPYPD